MGPPEIQLADPTTIQVSRAQRAAIADIQADLITASGRHVTTKETISTMIDFWKENHHADPA